MTANTNNWACIYEILIGNKTARNNRKVNETIYRNN